MTIIKNKMSNSFFCNKLNYSNNVSTIPNILGSRVLFSKYYSTGRLTKIQKDSYSISENLHDIIIGLSLGDLYIQNFRNINARLMFKQGIVHQEYLYHLFDLFSSYSNMKEPKQYIYLDKRNNKVFISVAFNTYSLPCFNYYHKLFYVNGVKRIPLNIGDLLSPQALAYWAIDDGFKVSSGFTLCTQSFLKEEVELLSKGLKDKFNINSTIQTIKPKTIKNKESYMIYIRADSINLFKDLVKPYFHGSMMYKLD
jgi:hypothetical protein